MIDETFARHGVRFTIGGEPTFVPGEPDGDEWRHAAIGPGKLAAARAMAEHLLDGPMRGGACFFSPGKTYPGERDPRWSLCLIARRDGKPMFPTASSGHASDAALAMLRSHLCGALGLENTWRRFVDPTGDGEVWGWLLDAAPAVGAQAWTTATWPPEARELVHASGPAGLRLPLDQLPADVPRRALTLERRGERLAVFLPPLLQPTFVQLLETLADGAQAAGIGPIGLQGVVPPDEAGHWIRLGLSADPGVLEVNLPACRTWAEYDRWMQVAGQAAAAVGLRPWRPGPHGRCEETGGGNHLLWGGPHLDDHPFFPRPGWLASILRYWQRHPALSYLFSGDYLGPSSQAPRADESGRELHDLEWTWSYLAGLPPGDRRLEIADAVRHLQADATGNTHRTEISFDKFWCLDTPGGGQGLVEFRAIAMMPEIEWASNVALLWSALAAWLLEHPYRQPVVDHGRKLHDRYFLPSILWRDLEDVFSDLHAGGYPIAPKDYREIWNWRFPLLLDVRESDDTRLTIRQAGEHWPTLSDVPREHGLTSRFVDSSLRRLEVLATESFAEKWTVEVNGRPVPLAAASELPGRRIAGLRYRHSRLAPSLHPGIPPQLPLRLTLRSRGGRQDFELPKNAPGFIAADSAPAVSPGPPCQPIHPRDLTIDLRLGISGGDPGRSGDHPPAKHR